MPGLRYRFIWGARSRKVGEKRERERGKKRQKRERVKASEECSEARERAVLRREMVVRIGLEPALFNPFPVKIYICNERAGESC